MSRQLGSQAVDDVVADVFFSFFQRADYVSCLENVQAYLFAIVNNRIRLEIRKRILERCAFGHAELDAACSTDSPAAHAAVQELRAILLRLRERERNAFVLHEIAGLNLDQVSESLGISRSTTKRRVAAAHASVRRKAARCALLSEYL